LIQLNPVTAPVELFRYAVLGVGTVNMASMIISVLFTSTVLLLGIVIFNRVERTFMDTV
jgi:lipopolysaccharide transport system permease protein